MLSRSSCDTRRQHSVVESEDVFARRQTSCFNLVGATRQIDEKCLTAYDKLTVGPYFNVSVALSE